MYPSAPTPPVRAPRSPLCLRPRVSGWARHRSRRQPCGGSRPVSFRTILILINVVSHRGAGRVHPPTDHPACGAIPSTARPRTSRRSSTTRCSKARTSNACSASHFVALGGRAARHGRLTTRASRSGRTRRATFLFAFDRAGRSALRQPPVEGLRLHHLGCSARTATASTVVVAWHHYDGEEQRPEQGPDARRRTTTWRDKRSYCLPTRCHGRRPTLQKASLRYNREQITNIITYGRPGTPMPA